MPRSPSCRPRRRCTYLGGPRPHGEVGREMPEVPGRRSGSFVVDLDGVMIGQILPRRITKHVCPSAVGKVDLGYLFLPRAWGLGYAAEACVAALDWLEAALPGGPVCSPIRPPMSVRYASRQSWGSPKRNGSGPGTPITGSACGPLSRLPIELEGVTRRHTVRRGLPHRETVVQLSEDAVLQGGAVVLTQQRSNLVGDLPTTPNGDLPGPALANMVNTWTSSLSAGSHRRARMSVRRMFARIRTSPTVRLLTADAVLVALGSVRRIIDGARAGSLRR